jgi:hypothetical protein
MPNLGEGRTIAQKSSLPRDLSRRGSDLDRLITIAGDAAAEGTFGAADTVAVTRSVIRRLCPDYRPSKACHIDVLCGSGEDSGQPFRTGCGKCLVGQFTAAGKFLGDVIPTSALVSARQ